MYQIPRDDMYGGGVLEPTYHMHVIHGSISVPHPRTLSPTPFVVHCTINLAFVTEGLTCGVYHQALCSPYYLIDIHLGFSSN